MKEDGRPATALDTDEGPGEPDGFLVLRAAEQERFRAKLIRILFAVAVVVLAGSVAALVLIPGATGRYVATAGAIVIGVLAMATSGPTGKVRERPRPDTALEPARVLGSEVISWGNAHGVHTVRVIAEVFDGPGPDLGLVHGYLAMDVDSGCEVAPGTLLGIRRHPSMKYLAWIEEHVDPRHLAILALEARAARGLIDEADLQVAREGQLTTATVTALHPSEARIGAFCALAVELRHADGTTGTANGYHLPEDVALLAPGMPVRVFRAGTPSRTVVALGLPA